MDIKINYLLLLLLFLIFFVINMIEKNGPLPYYDFYFNWYHIVYHDSVIELQFMIMVIFTNNS